MWHGGILRDPVRRHIPNAITAARGLMGPAVAWLLIAHGANRAAFFLFIAAICTDLVDGWVARKLDAMSPLGAWLDAVADKLLTDTTWLALWAVGYAPAWLALVMIGRDLGVSAAWTWAYRRGKRWAPSAIGQTAIAFEGVALPVLLFRGPWLDVHWPSVGVALGTIALALSAASVIDYSVKGPGPKDPPP